MASFYEIEFHGGALARGFWLYVWEVTLPDRTKAYYVGRTGDSSSMNAQSPFNRMGQHLGHAKNSCMLRTHLKKLSQKVDPGECEFRLVAYGPILSESKSLQEHNRRRDLIGAAEKILAEALAASGYAVMNTVRCRKRPDANLNRRIRGEFSKYFPRLSNEN